MDESRLEREALKQGLAWRMSLSMRIQHAFMALCILVLAATGLALFFADTAVGRWLIEIQGGFHNRGTIHRLAAVGLIGSLVFHLGYSLFSRHGSREFRRRMLRGDDFRQLAEAVSYKLGGRDEPPAAGKYTFGQKLHYWLSGFFILTMIISGLILWNPTAAMALLPQWLIPVVLALHGWEGLILVITAVVWHLYDVHLSPRNFPMSGVWLSGKMPLEKAKRYHRMEYERLTQETPESEE